MKIYKPTVKVTGDATGDMLYRSASGELSRLGIGDAYGVLSINGAATAPQWTTSGNLTETTSSILTITGGTRATIGTGTSIQVKKASVSQDGYLGKDDFLAFSSGGHNPVTLNASAIVGGLSLNTQEISFRAATGSLDGYLKRSDWTTFNNKQNTLSFYNLSEVTSGVLTITGGPSSVVTNAVTIQVNKASVSQDGYLGKDNWATFNAKEPALTKGNLTEASSSILIFSGSTTNNVIGTGTAIQVKKASASQDGYLGKDDFATFSSGGHNPVTLNASAITGGLSLNTQEISFRAADTTYDGYLKSSDWDTFNSKEPTVTKGNLTSNTTSAITITSGTGVVIGSGTSITLNKASASSDGYLGKDNWSTFNSKEPAQTKGAISSGTASAISIANGTSSTVGPNVSISINKASVSLDGYLGKDDWAMFNGKQDAITKYDLLETSSSILSITGGTDSVLTNDVTIAVQKASAIQDGYLGKDDFSTFSASTHSPVTLSASAVTGGLSLNTQELSFRAADTTYDGYLKSSDWDTFNGKQNALTPGDISSGTASVIDITNGSDSTIGPNVTIAINKASASLDGYLGKDNWATFNGKVNGAGTVVDNSIVRFNGIDGKTIQDSTVIISDDGYIGVNLLGLPKGQLHIQAEDPIWTDVYLENASTYTSSSACIDFYRTRGTIASKTIVNDNDALGTIWFSGWDGSKYELSSYIGCEVDGTPNVDDVPCRIVFGIKSANVGWEAARITKDGYMLIGTTDDDGTPDVGRLVVAGTTADGTSNIFVGRDSSGANVATLNTDGYWTMAGATIDALSGLLKATAGVVGVASGGVDYESPVTKGNLTSGTASAISISSGDGSVIGGGTSISINKASASLDGYLGKDNWATFNGKIGGAGTVADHSIVRFNGTSGNAVHGSTSYITDDGYIGINTSNPEGQLHILSDIFTVANLETSSNSETSFLKFNRSRGTSSSKENVQAGDVLGGIWSYGWGGSFYAPTAGIDFIAESNASGGWVPGAIKFWIASVEGDEVARITKDGYMLIGTTDDDGTPAVGRLIVQGYSSDSTTNIFVGRSSSGANVSTLDSTGKWTMANATIGSLGGLLKATAGVVGIASSGTDYEPPVTKGDLTESGSSIITFGGSTTGNVIGAGTTISIYKASVAQDGYLGKDDFAIFNGKQDAITKYDLSETSSSILSITGGTDSVLTNDVTIAVQKASAIQDGYLGKDDFSTFSASTHSPVTLSASAVTGGLSLNTQEISFRAADTTYDGYLKSSDWDTFNGKQDVITKYDLSETSSSILSITGGTDSVLTNDVTIAVQKASVAQDGYLGKDNWATFNGKLTSPMTTNGDLIARIGGVADRLGIGSTGQVLTVAAGLPAWADPAAGTQITQGDTKVYIKDTGSDGYMAVVTEGVERMRITPAGYIGIGTSSPVTLFDISDNVLADCMVNTANSNALNSSVLSLRRARNTIASPSIVSSGDSLGVIEFDGYDGAQYRCAGYIEMHVDGTPGVNDMPGVFSLYLTPDGSWSSTEVVTVKSDGKMGIGVTEPSSALDVAGSVEVTSTEWFYIGSPTADGSWRMGLDTGDFVVQKRVTGSWVTKGSFA